MIQGQICTQEVAIASDNILNEFCNFNQVFVWNKSSGGANATILNNVAGGHSYYGLGAVSINFSGTGEVTFDSGDSSMQVSIQRTGNYILSYAFDKSDENADILFTVEMYVNGTLQPQNTIQQDLFDSSGFVNGQWNTYFQNVNLEDGDVVDFVFKAQSDTTACYLYFDRMKLEINDKGNSFPTIYTEAPLDVIEEENTITIPEIANNETYIVTASLTGCTLVDNYVVMKYPSELNDLGLTVGYPSVYTDNVVKFGITNNTGAPVTPTADEIYNFKVVRNGI
jgi:hypothetical protein